MSVLVRRKTLPATLVTLISAFLFSGCGAICLGGIQSQINRMQHAERMQRAEKYGIEARYLPPPGQCRVWYHGKPNGEQPPPGDCRDLAQDVPRGAILVRG